MAKARYADNLEFIQWMKRFCQTKGESKDYDPVKRRNGTDVDFSFAEKIIQPKIFLLANVSTLNLLIIRKRKINQEFKAKCVNHRWNHPLPKSKR